ncbi:MAG: hypothetical protein PHY93_20665 [Bacteriovorax sp.]|nr:hypothetical protein [Bacteriovorax sp.]
MNLLLSTSVLFLISANSFATKLTDLKIDAKWMVKYDPNEWSYIYLKPTLKISPNIFEYRKDKIRVVLQRETHFDEAVDYQKLVERKCAEANQYYSKKASGHSEIVNINFKKVCYIEYKNVSGEMTHQFVYPELSQNKSYDIYSYGWNSNNHKSKEIVINFLKGFLQ